MQRKVVYTSTTVVPSPSPGIDCRRRNSEVVETLRIRYVFFEIPLGRHCFRCTIRELFDVCYSDTDAMCHVVFTLWYGSQVMNGIWILIIENKGLDNDGAITD